MYHRDILCLLSDPVEGLARTQPNISNSPFKNELKLISRTEL